MKAPRYARWAARLLARHEPPLPSTVPSRARGLATIERALEAQRPRRSWAAIAGLAACAAAGLAWVALGRFEAGPPSVARAKLVSILASPIREGALLRDSQGETPLELITVLPSGGRISTKPGGGAALQLSTGTRLELGSASDLTLQRQDELQLFALQRGLLDARVSKLGPGQRFVIDTPDAQMEVRGTVFQLEVLQGSEPCGGGTRSRLEVREGVVEVRSGSRVVRVAAGEHWPADCEPGTRVGSEGPAAAEPSASEGTETAPAVSKPALPASKARSPKRSALATQNDAFQAALRTQERADTTGALRAYAQFIRRYPASPLSENAQVERLRLLATSDPELAKAEAAGYLARYPNGFARAEAQRLQEAP
ncbi:MAG: FecR domain-containing protein [Deltaproteobacteria bacterium]